MYFSAHIHTNCQYIVIIAIFPVASTSACSFGTIEERFNAIQWLKRGGTYLLPPLDSMECSGQLVSIDACFQYTPEDQMPDVFTMEVGVFRFNPNTIGYDNRHLSSRPPLIELMLWPDDENQRCKKFNLTTVDQLTVESGDMIGVLIQPECRNRSDGTVDCPLRPNFRSSKQHCEVLRSNGVRTRHIPKSSTTVSDDCINLKAAVVGSK